MTVTLQILIYTNLIANIMIIGVFGYLISSILKRKSQDTTQIKKGGKK